MTFEQTMKERIVIKKIPLFLGICAKTQNRGKIVRQVFARMNSILIPFLAQDPFSDHLKRIDLEARYGTSV